MICNAKQLAGFSIVLIFSERFSKQALTHSQPVFHLNKPGHWFLLAKCLKKHMWKGHILSKEG